MMKTYLSLLLFALVSLNSGAQITNSVYLDYSSLWHFHGAGWNGIYGYETFTTCYIDGDTTAGGQEYYKYFRYVHTITNSSPVSETYTLYGPYLLREDASHNFVYYYNGSESLNLDNAAIAAANVGDPFPAPGATCNVEDVQYNTIGSQTVKHLIGPLNLPQAGIAEGIGYVGPTCAMGVEGNEVMVCYYRSGDSVCFSNSFAPEDFPEPQYMSLGVEEMNTSDIAFYPNPATEQLVIDPLTEAGKTEWFVYSTSGQLIDGGTTEKLTTVNVSSWNSGIYFLHLVNEKGNRSVRKIAIE